MKSRFSRDARHRAKPRATRLHKTTTNQNDEFDESPMEALTLHKSTVREYIPKVPQTWTEDVESKVKSDRANIMGPIFEGFEPTVVSNTLDSFTAAFNKRANSQPDKGLDCTPAFQKKALKLWDDFYSRMPAFDSFDVTEHDFDRWLAKMDQGKQKRMLVARERLDYALADAKGIHVKDLSLKNETLWKNGNTIGRLIYAGTDEFNVYSGPIVMIIMERLVTAFSLAPLGNIWIKLAYKTNDVDLCAHLNYSEGALAEEVDFTANDLYQLPFVRKVVAKAIAGVGTPGDFISFLDDAAEFSVRSREFGLFAQLAHQLATGTTMTTPRNSIWNGTIEGVYSVEQNNHGNAVILGDDFLGVFERRYGRDFADWVETETGMVAKHKTVPLNAVSTLLSRRLCYETPTPCMMPKLGKALARFNARASPDESITDSAYMAGKALSYAYEFRHFPVFSKIFLGRYGLEEDRASVSVDEVSWFTRTSGIDLDRLVELISAETVTVSEDCTREFIMDTYGAEFGLCDAIDIAERIVLSKEVTTVEMPPQFVLDM